MRPLTSVATSGCSPLLPTQALQAFQACTTTTLGLVVPAILLPAATPPSRRTTITRVDEHDDDDEDDDDDDDDDDDVASNSVSAVDGGASGPRVLPSGPSTRQQHAHGVSLFLIYFLSMICHPSVVRSVFDQSSISLRSAFAGNKRKIRRRKSLLGCSFTIRYLSL
ncbi:hypothetical protein K0M31_000508 [Melipona bicolor]|uniref:Uncharacterized protein n=1 Tax=Melipona bicolor TaxID=60889 RepID=A0AA40KWT0_9HYME|nr:hypothetical protein K0M31_000508 [Melipona bicolor]